MSNELETTSPTSPTEVVFNDCTCTCPVSGTNQTVAVVDRDDSSSPTSTSTSPTAEVESTETNQLNEEDVIHLRFLGNPNVMWVEQSARAFEASKQGRVKVTIVYVDFGQLFADTVNEAKSKVGLYDGFLSPPSVSGSVVEHAGFADLRPFIQESAENLADWSDILLGYRQNLAQYEDQIIMFPLDGDILSMYYRKDVLEHFGLQVPRTWDEFNMVAKATHGKVWTDGTVLNGSCVGRVPHCAGAYWGNLLLSSMTQTHGASTGHLFDTADMKPLAGPALEQVLHWMADQVKYGSADEFETCIEPNTEGMINGQCVLTYNWGMTFVQHTQDGSALMDGNLGVAPTPGSTRVLDRNTMSLIPCDEERCKYGDYYEDIGWVNRAPYLAFGGWSCAVNNYTDKVHKRLATEFCAFASTFSSSGHDPFRKSQLDPEHFIKQGYRPETTTEYLKVVRTGIESKNAVTDIRFPSATQIYGVLDVEMNTFLKRTKDGLIQEEKIEKEVSNIVSGLTQDWLNIVAENDDAAQVPTLEMYQRLRGVYVEDNDMQYIGDIRIFGDILASLVVVSALGFLVWTWCVRKSFVVRASQPVFLSLICIGALILGSSIVPLGLDDEDVSEEAASRACMAVPWLLVMGWSLLSSVLGAKLHCVNMVFQNAVNNRRVQVSMKDFIVPLLLLTLMNCSVLLVWTMVDPACWKREDISDSKSIGKCQYNTGNVSSKVCVSLLAITNGLTLLYTNYQAYKARHMASEYGESQQIAMAMGSILQIVIVSVPLLYIVEDNVKATYFLRASIVFVACQSILWFMFLPKILAWARGVTAADTPVTNRWKTPDRNGDAVGNAPNAHKSIVSGQFAEREIREEESSQSSGEKAYPGFFSSITESGLEPIAEQEMSAEQRWTGGSGHYSAPLKTPTRRFSETASPSDAETTSPTRTDALEEGPSVSTRDSKDSSPRQPPRACPSLTEAEDTPNTGNSTGEQSPESRWEPLSGSSSDGAPPTQPGRVLSEIIVEDM